MGGDGSAKMVEDKNEKQNKNNKIQKQNKNNQIQKQNKNHKIQKPNKNLKILKFYKNVPVMYKFEMSILFVGMMAIGCCASDNKKVVLVKLDLKESFGADVSDDKILKKLKLSADEYKKKHALPKGDDLKFPVTIEDGK